MNTNQEEVRTEGSAAPAQAENVDNQWSKYNPTENEVVEALCRAIAAGDVDAAHAILDAGTVIFAPQSDIDAMLSNNQEFAAAYESLEAKHKSLNSRFGKVLVEMKGVFIAFKPLIDGLPKGGKEPGKMEMLMLGKKMVGQVMEDRAVFQNLKFDQSKLELHKNKLVLFPDIAAAEEVALENRKTTK